MQRGRDPGKGCVRMGYVYAGLWVIVGLILIFSAAKENKVFYFAGGFFLLLGAWWAADSFLPQDLFQGPWRTALNIVTLAALVGLSAVFFVERQKSMKREMMENPPKDGGDDEI